jgi:CHASE2 domain-containing sensor protein
MAFSIAYQVFWYSVIIGLVFIISSFFHFHNEKRIEYVDITSSTSLMLSNFILLFQGRWIFPYSILAIICAVIALCFYFYQHKGVRGYNFYHGWWHIFSAGVSFFCLATFLSFIHLL